MITEPQYEASKRNPDWHKTAQLIAEQSGCEDFPVDTVDDILAKPGELIVGVLPRGEDFFAIGAIIAAKKRPFGTVLMDDDGRLVALEILSEVKEVAPGYDMIGEREISFNLRRGESGDISNHMGPGIHSREDGSNMIFLTTKTPAPELAIGTAEVNAFFEELASQERFAPYKDRLVGLLFQTAWLAVDFYAPTPTAPEVLQPEVTKAKEYYKTAQLIAQSIAETRKKIDILVEGLEHHSTLSRPAIHYEQPIKFPTLAKIQEIQHSIAWPPSDSEVRHALESYGEAITILDALSTD